MKNDDRSPSELRELARQEGAGLGAEARARVLARLHEEGPQVVRRARTQRQLTQAASVIAGVVLAVTGAWMVSDRTQSTPGPDSIARARPCESRPISSGHFMTGEGGELVLDLGARAFVRAEANSVIRIAENEACRLVLSLEQGRVDVHARDLGAGELHVLTEEGRVEVRGTIFSVARGDGELTVDVAEGVVEVASDEEPKASVRRGERLRRVRKKVQRSGLEESEELRLLLAVRAIEPDETEEVEEEVAALDPGPAIDEAPEPRAERKAKRSPKKKRRWKRRPVERERPAVDFVEPAPEPLPPPSPVPTARVAPEPPAETLDELLAEADRLKRAGDLTGARRALRRAGERPGPDARAAWISLARLELQAGNTADVRGAVSEYHRRGGGPLEPEGAWILVRAEERAGRHEEARAEAASLLRRWPSTPQAEEARRWILRADAGSSP